MTNTINLMRRPGILPAISGVSMFLPAASRLVFHPKGTLLASMGDEGVSVIEDRKPLWTRDLPAHDVAWFSSPEALLVGTRDGYIHWLDPRTGDTRTKQKVDAGPVWVAGSTGGQAAAMTRDGELYRWFNGSQQETLELAMRPISHWLGGLTDDLVWIEEGGTAVHWSIDRVHGESYRRAKFPEHRAMAWQGSQRFLLHDDRIDRVELAGSEWRAVASWPFPDKVVRVKDVAPSRKLMYVLTHDEVHLLNDEGESIWQWATRGMEVIAATQEEIAVAGRRYGSVFKPQQETPPGMEAEIRQMVHETKAPAPAEE